MTITQQIITIGLYIAGTMLTRFLPFAIFNEKQKKLPLCSILANSCHPLSLVCWWSTACAMSMYCLARTDCRSLSPFL